MKDRVIKLKKELKENHKGLVLSIKAVLGISQTLVRFMVYMPYVPLALLIRLMYPFMLVRIGFIYSSRIGHFAANTELYVLETVDLKNNRPRKILDFVCCEPSVSNKQLYSMWQRSKHFTILPRLIVWPIYQANRCFPGWRTFTAGSTIQSDRDVLGLLRRYPKLLNFTEEEELQGLNLLKSMGIPRGAKYVCLHVRDSKYLSKNFPKRDFMYHDYRNSKIQDYVEAAEALADLGVYVIRMGRDTEEPLKSDNPMIVEYSHSTISSDFNDIYLGATCYFCLSGCSGFAAVPTVFRRPVLYVNLVPVEYFQTYNELSLVIFKHHYDIKTEEEITFEELFKRGVGKCLTSKCFEERGVRLRDNSPQEIREAALEMLERLEATFVESPYDDIVQQSFWDVFPDSATDLEFKKPLHGQIRAKVSSSFLRANSHLLGQSDSTEYSKGLQGLSAEPSGVVSKIQGQASG